MRDSFNKRVLMRIYNAEHIITAIDVARYFEVHSPEYGWQQKVNTAISSLRKRGLIVDCPRNSLGGATSRGERNRPLELTDAGIRECRLG